jgi:hypothetical protein
MQSKVASYFCLHQPNEHHFSERNYEVLHIPILVHVKRAAILAIPFINILKAFGNQFNTKVTKYKMSIQNHN